MAVVSIEIPEGATVVALKELIDDCSADTVTGAQLKESTEAYKRRPTQALQPEGDLEDLKARNWKVHPEAKFWDEEKVLLTEDETVLSEEDRMLLRMEQNTRCWWATTRR